MKKKIYCEKCKREIMTIDLEYVYQAVGSNYLTVSAHYFDWDVDVSTELPRDKGYEYNHYYHFECWDKPIPAVIPRVINIFEEDN